MRLNKKLIIGYFCIFVVCSFIFINPLNLRIQFNITNSLPDNFFITKAITNDTKLNIGDIISFPFVRDDRYYKKGTNFGKAISCKEGQYLYVDKNKSFYCDGKLFTTALNVDSKGNKIDAFIWDGIIPKDKFFVLGSSLNSYDSRYWGFVDRKDIKGVVIW